VEYLLGASTVARTLGGGGLVVVGPRADLRVIRPIDLRRDVDQPPG